MRTGYCYSALLLLWTLFLELTTHITCSEDPTLIRLHKGWVHGNRHNVNGGTIVHEYLGIPMGKPPVGEKRYKRPEAVDPWMGSHNATQRSAACYNVLDTLFGSEFLGSNMWNPLEEMSEDCLYINAWVPNPDDRTSKRAILVWIYGGGFYSGSSTLDIYDGRYLAASQNVIVISMQYRLGILGFLNLESEDAPGNMGLMDQVMGLQWTQDNAEYLNGDKNNVTISGESAGAVSVSLHLISPLSRDLYNRAILQSGSSTADWTIMSRESSWMRLNKTSKFVGCPTETTHVPTLMKCLRQKPAKEVFDGTWAPDGPIQFSWLPSIDYHFLYEMPEVSLKNGDFKKCPILIGSNANEGSWFIVYELYESFGRNAASREINFTIPHDKHTENMDKCFRYYPQWNTRMNQFGKDAITFRYTDWRNKDDSILNRHNLDQAIGDYHFLCPVNKFAQYYIKWDLPVYSYHFTHRSTQNPWGEWMGVMHGDEIMFMFGLPIRPNSGYDEDEKLLSEHMMKLWADFSKRGNPNDPDGPAFWPEASLLGKEYYEISVPSLRNPTIKSGPRTEYCAFWESYIPNLVHGTADIQNVEKDWKDKFAQWSDYIVNWKHEYNRYIKTQYMETGCQNGRGKRDVDNLTEELAVCVTSGQQLTSTLSLTVATLSLFIRLCY